MPKQTSRKKFGYKGRSDEDIERRAKQQSGRYDSFLTEDLPFYKLRAGENHIRILPWLDGNDPDFAELDEKWGNHWGIDLMTHRNVGVDKGSYLCLDKMNGEPCPICDVWRSEEAEPLKPSARVLAWVIDRKEEKAGPQLWAMPLGTSKDISAACKIKSTGESLLIDDPEEGYDIFFDKEGEKERTRYTHIEVDREPSPVHDNEAKQDQWLNFIADHRLPDMLKFYEADYLEKVLGGQISKQGEEDEEAAEDDGESRSSRRGRSRGAEEDEPATTSRRERAARSRGGDYGEEFTRPSRRGRGAEEETSEEVDGETGEVTERPLRGRRGRAEPETRRGRSRGAEPEGEGEAEPEADEPAPERSSRRGSRGGGTQERFRGRAAAEEDAPAEDDGEDVTSARKRLRNVGRRGR
jgi:hypothetical protein